MKIAAIRPNAKASAPSSYKEYSDKKIQSYASPGTEITVIWPDVDPNIGGWGGHLSEARVQAMAPHVVREAVKAEKDGFDGIIITGEYNVGSEVARHVVNVPLIDGGTVSLHVAALLGDRICVLIPEDTAKSYAIRLFRRWGMLDFICSIKTWDFPVQESWERKAEVKEKTINLCKKVVEEDDAQVILPFCGPFVPMVVSAEEIEAEVGVPVIDKFAVAVKMIEMFVNLNIHTSRKGYPFYPYQI